MAYTKQQLQQKIADLKDHTAQLKERLAGYESEEEKYAGLVKSRREGLDKMSESLRSATSDMKSWRDRYRTAEENEERYTKLANELREEVQRDPALRSKLENAIHEQAQWKKNRDAASAKVKYYNVERGRFRSQVQRLGEQLESTEKLWKEQSNNVEITKNRIKANETLQAKYYQQLVEMATG